MKSSSIRLTMAETKPRRLSEANTAIYPARTTATCPMRTLEEMPNENKRTHALIQAASSKLRAAHPMPAAQGMGTQICTTSKWVKLLHRATETTTHVLNTHRAPPKPWKYMLCVATTLLAISQSIKQSENIKRAEHNAKARTTLMRCDVAPWKTKK